MANGFPRHALAGNRSALTGTPVVLLTTITAHPPSDSVPGRFTFSETSGDRCTLRWLLFCEQKAVCHRRFAAEAA